MLHQIALNAPAGAGRFAPAPATRHATPADGALHLERRQFPACAAIEPEWSDLAARAVEANPFFEPEFALPAAQHLVSFRDVSVLLVWQGAAAGPRRLLGFIPSLPNRRLFGADELAGWSDHRLGSAAPLIDRDAAGRVVAALLEARGRWGGPAYRGLAFSGIDLEGPLARALLGAAEARGCAATLRAERRLQPAPAEGGPDLAALRHGLSRHGELAFAEAGSRSGLRDMVELVLALEASGPLARAGGATLQDTRETAFLRSMTRNLARTRQCRAGLLTLAGEPVAGAILLGGGPRRWLYAAAQDERFASFAPLAQLIALLRRRRRAEEVIGSLAGRHAVTDALALGEFRLLRTSALRRRAETTSEGGLSLPRAGAAG